MALTKLAIVGGSSSGKTTLFDELVTAYKGNSKIAFVHESARQYFNDNPSENPFTLAIQEKILDLALLKEKLARENNPDVIITDTSALEVIFYTRAKGDNEGADHLLKRLEDYIPTYTKFLVMNHEEVKFENDKIRKEDKQTRDIVHEMILDFYEKRDLPFEKISGTISERKKRVMEIISSYLRNDF